MVVVDVVVVVAVAVSSGRLRNVTIGTGAGNDRLRLSRHTLPQQVQEQGPGGS